MIEKSRPHARKSESKISTFLTQKANKNRNAFTGSRNDKIIYFQRTIGNQAVGRLLKSCILQTKSGINTSDDKYEMKPNRVSTSTINMAEPSLQRRLTPKEEDTQTTQPTEHSTPVQRQAVNEEMQSKSEAFTLSFNDEAQAIRGKKQMPLRNDFEDRLSSAKSGGRHLTKKSRNEFEQVFGIDLGGTRIHTDSQAAQMSQDIGVQAFTHQNHIFFNQGRYNPETIEGKRLLAHELTHTIQQQTVNKSNVQDSMTLSNPKDTAEQEADSAANRVVTGRSVQVNQSVNRNTLSAWRGIFDITTRLPKSRKFSVASGSVRVESTTTWRRPASCPESSTYSITLWRYRMAWWDANHGRKTYPVPGTGTHTWSKLPNGKYYLEIYWPNTNPHCRIDGHLNVT